MYLSMIGCCNAARICGTDKARKSCQACFTRLLRPWPKSQKCRAREHGRHATQKGRVDSGWVRESTLLVAQTAAITAGRSFGCCVM